MPTLRIHTQTVFNRWYRRGAREDHFCNTDVGKSCSSCIVAPFNCRLLSWSKRTSVNDRCVLKQFALNVHVYLSVCLSVYLSFFLFIHPSIFLFIHPSIYLPIYLCNLYLSIYLSVCLSVCLSIYLSIYLLALIVEIIML